MEDKMIRKLDDRGLSLVELVIAIAMYTIVLGAVMSFLYGAQKSYRTAEYTVNLQMEAQLLMEQMSNWVMESNHIEIGGIEDSNYLVLYQIPRSKIEDTTLVRLETLGTRKIIYMNNGKLYIKIDNEASAGAFESEIKNDTLDTSFLTGTPDEEYCIGEYVISFTAKVPDGVDANKINSVNIDIDMYEGLPSQSQSYSISDRFSLRNAVYVVESDE